MVPLVIKDDDDGHLTALQIIQDVVRKGGELFLDNFARLGLFGKVLALAGPPEEENNDKGSDKVRALVLERIYLCWTGFLSFFVLICF